MKRREFLVAVTGGAGVSLAGCVSDASSAGPTITDYSFDIVPAEDVPDDAEIVSASTTTSMGELTIAGTATVRNGCTDLAVGSEPAFEDEGRTISVMVGTREQDVGGCTQALKDIGYRLVIEYEGARPDHVEVAQAGVDSETFRLAVPGGEGE